MGNKNAHIACCSDWWTKGLCSFFNHSIETLPASASKNKRPIFADRAFMLQSQSVYNFSRHSWSTPFVLSVRSSSCSCCSFSDPFHLDAWLDTDFVDYCCNSHFWRFWTFFSAEKKSLPRCSLGLVPARCISRHCDRFSLFLVASALLLFQWETYPTAVALLSFAVFLSLGPAIASGRMFNFIRDHLLFNVEGFLHRSRSSTQQDTTSLWWRSRDRSVLAVRCSRHN